jgi:hypothetical protein
MTRRKLILSTVTVAAVALGALGGMKLAASSAERSDCPGKIVCPLTGQLVCKDRCPLGAGAEKPPCCQKKN